MKLLHHLRKSGLWLLLCALPLSQAGAARAQSFATTTVQGTIYLAGGQPGSGTLQVSWPAFTTAAGQAVAAGRTNITIGADGFVSLNLAPNQGATPAGLYYTAVYHLSDGTTSTEYWTVPAVALATLGQVRAQVMPAAQAVQAVSKSYVDQSIQLLTQSLLTASGGTLSGPLTATRLGAVYQADQFAGADFGAQLQACVRALDKTYGGTCDARNYAGSLAMAAPLTISTGNVTVLLPCSTITTASAIAIAPGARNVTLHGCASRGTSSGSGSQGGTVFAYSGVGALIEVGDASYAADTLGFHLDNVAINTTAATAATAQAVAAWRTQELHLESLYLLGNAAQTGITLDGTGNYTGGTFTDVELVGYGTGIRGIGHQLANPAATDWLNASAFLRLHIVCPTDNGTPVSGSIGIDLQQGDGNTFTGGDVESCATALHLGANAQNNTVVGLRNENSTNQVVADAGSAYNNWISGGTLFTGRLTDNGTRNSFLDTFHRSFNALNGDWFGSQQDATLTNHYRLGTGAGNERGLLHRYQTDAGYRWTMGLSDATAGAQFYQVLDELNNVYRLSMGQYNPGQASTNNQTVINAAGTGAVVLNGSKNAGTGGVVFGAGGANGATVATVNNAGNAQFNGTLQVGGASTFLNTTTVKNQADAEIDSVLWAGVAAPQKESFVYKDWNGASQWYMVKDASNNWALNSATGGLDSFKAYQSTNSGDTYVNASNAGGAVRINYETGAGAAFHIYGGGSSALYASFTGANAIKFPGLAAASGRNCVQIDNSGYLSNTGMACGSGTVNSGSAGQIAYYNGNGAAVAGLSTVPLTAGGTGAADAATALANLGGVSLSGATMTGALTAPTFNGTLNGSVNGTATHAQNLAADLATQSAASPQAASFTNVTAQTTLSNVPTLVNVKASPYFAKGDARTVTNLAVTAGSKSVTSPTANFSASDNGKLAYVWMGANGVVSGTYTGGITAVGAAGQTCSLSFTDGGGSGGSAFVELTDTNTIASGSLLHFTAFGSGYAAAPATASVTAGTAASCSATATVSTTLQPLPVLTSITYVSPTQATLGTAATVTGTTTGIFGSDDSGPLQAALTANANTASTVYLPCGTYLSSLPLAVVPAVTAGGLVPTEHLRGEGLGCATVEYVGATAAPVLNVAPSAANVFFTRFGMEDLRLLGNGNTTAVLALDHAADIDLDDVDLWGANPATGACLTTSDVVGGTVKNLRCSNYMGALLPTPANGMVFDGTATTQQSTTLTIDSPRLDMSGATGIGLWLKNTARMNVHTCQFNGANQALNIGALSHHNQLNDCLLEQGFVDNYVGGYNNVLINPGASPNLAASAAGGGFTLDGNNNKLINAITGNQSTIATVATAQQNQVNGAFVGRAPVDASGTTTYLQLFTTNQANTDLLTQNVWAVNAQNTWTGNLTAQTYCSHWRFPSPSGVVPIGFTPLAFPNGVSAMAWRAVVRGVFGKTTAGTSSAGDAAWEQIDESNNTVAAAIGTITFSAANGGVFQMSGPTSGGATFDGCIDFYPNPSAASSGSYAGVRTRGGVNAHQGIASDASLSVAPTTAASTGSGAVMTVGDAVAANAQPFVYSYMPGATSGATADFGFNVYTNGAGIGVRRNTNLGGYVWECATGAAADCDPILYYYPSSGAARSKVIDLPQSPASPITFSASGGAVSHGTPVYSMLSAVALSSTVYVPYGVSGISGTTEATATTQSTAPATGNITNLYVQLSADPGAGNTVTVTLRINAVSKALTCTITGSSGGTNKTCSDTTHTNTPVAGNLVDWMIAKTGTISGSPAVSIATKWVGQ